MAAYCCIMGLSLMLILTAELLPRVTVVFWEKRRKRSQRESREQEETRGGEQRGGDAPHCPD